MSYILAEKLQVRQLWRAAEFCTLRALHALYWHLPCPSRSRPMNMLQLIEKKVAQEALSTEEIAYFVQGYTAGNIPDYQAAALLMSIRLKGMDRQETVALTLCMAETGSMLDLSDITDYAVDKHSSGGIGDKTSLIVLPLVASFGIAIAKMSGRGLGLTGGTLDKLESIRGFDVNLPDATFRRIARESGLVIGGQSPSMVPADGKLFALRDVTGTVASLPLIASSIMSKKLAAGSKGIVLDVKIGRGAFMKTVAQARSLAETMVRIGSDSQRDVVALLSNMEQPLGVAVGNALEVAEAIQTLQGRGPADTHAHCVEVAAHMLQLAGRGQRWTELEDARAQANQALRAGQAFDRFRQMVADQGGDVAQVDDSRRLPQATLHHTLQASAAGYISAVPADTIGWAAQILGAGRLSKADSIDHAVGIEVHVNVGDIVQSGDKLLTLHANDESAMQAALDMLAGAIALQAEPAAALPLFFGSIQSRPR